MIRDHGLLDEVSRRTLAQRVDHLPLGTRALRTAGRPDVREVTPAALHCLDVPVYHLACRLSALGRALGELRGLW